MAGMAVGGMAMHHSKPMAYQHHGGMHGGKWKGKAGKWKGGKYKGGKWK